MQRPTNTEVHEISGQQVTSIDKFWLETGEFLIKESIPSLENAAKQLISITSILQTIYFAAISFSNLQKEIASIEQYKIIVSIIFISPIVCWIVAIAFATLVFIPQSYQTNLKSPTSNERLFLQIAERKHQSLHRAHIWLLLGFFFLLVVLLFYLILSPPLTPVNPS